MCIRDRKEAKEAGDSINDTHFRYPGPRPKTKEAAIMKNKEVNAIDIPRKSSRRLSIKLD